jgi:hypothetical protein
MVNPFSHYTLHVHPTLPRHRPTAYSKNHQAHLLEPEYRYPDDQHKFLLFFGYHVSKKTVAQQCSNYSNLKELLLRGAEADVSQIQAILLSYKGISSTAVA